MILFEKRIEVHELKERMYIQCRDSIKSNANVGHKGFFISFYFIFTLGEKTMYVEHRINGGWYKMKSITYFRLRRDLKDSNSKISKEISATLKKVLYLLLSVHKAEESVYSSRQVDH